MNDALRVYDHVYLLWFRLEQETRLDYFESFVHQCRRVNRNLASHYPFWMSTGLLWRNVLEQFAPRAQERSARCREPQAFHAGMREVAVEAAWQCLENRIVLAVYRHQHSAAGRHRIHQQGARHDEC